jgi:hypothetical protein
MLSKSVRRCLAGAVPNVEANGPNSEPNLGNDYVWICLGVWGTIGSRCVAGPARACHTRFGGVHALMKRNLIAAAIMSTVLATAACGGTDVAVKPTATRSPATPATSSSTSSLTPTIDPKAQPAVDAYLAYMTASNNALREPRALGQDFPPSADYTKYSFDPERSAFSAFIHQLSSQGLKMAGDPGRPRPKLRSIDFLAKPFPIVVLTDCPTPAVKWDAHDVKTGKNAAVPPPAGTVPPPYRTTVQVINYKNHWGVAKITTDSGRTCSG